MRGDVLEPQDRRMITTNQIEFGIAIGSILLIAIGIGLYDFRAGLVTVGVLVLSITIAGRLVKRA